MNRRLTMTMINMLMSEYSNRNVPMVHTYLKWYLDPNEKFNLVNDLEMTAEVLMERRVTFLIDLISNIDWKIARILYALCDEYKYPYSYQMKLELKRDIQKGGSTA
ncbi:hypothetical protein COK06_22985 [Bacillus cereus]|nr:hypothetical protein COK06_22985 [Bacillus cereus]